MEDSQDNLRRASRRDVDDYFRELEREIRQSGNLEKLDDVLYDQGERYIDDRFVDDEMVKIVDIAIRNLSSNNRNNYYDDRGSRYRDDRRPSRDGYRSFGGPPRAATNPNNDIYVGSNARKSYRQDDSKRINMENISVSGYQAQPNMPIVPLKPEDTHFKAEAAFKSPVCICKEAKSWSSPTGSEVFNYMLYKDHINNEIAVGSMEVEAGVISYEDLVTKMRNFIKDFEGKEFFVRALHHEYVVLKSGDPEVYTSQKVLEGLVKNRKADEYFGDVVSALNNTKTKVSRMWKQLISNAIAKELLTGVTYEGSLHKRAIWLEDFEDLGELLIKDTDENSITYKYQSTPGYWESLEAAYSQGFHVFTNSKNILRYSDPSQFNEIVGALKSFGAELPDGVERYHSILTAMEKADADKKTIYQNLIKEIEDALNAFVVFKIPRQTFFTSICDVLGVSHGSTQIKSVVKGGDSTLGFFLDASKRHILKTAVRDLVITDPGISYTLFNVSYTVDNEVFLHYHAHPRIAVEGRL